jgi:hypothetical protein
MLNSERCVTVMSKGASMERITRGIGMVGLGSAALLLTILHLLPTPHLRATTGTVIPYRPWNFLSEYVRTEYAPLMTACFFLLAVGVLGTAIAVRALRREAVLLTVAGISLALLGVFPTDLADLTTDTVTCGQSNRIEPCTLAGRIHNPLSTLVSVPILLTILSFCARSCREREWRGLAYFAALYGSFALCGIVAMLCYRYAVGWQGRWWTGLMQRCLVVPALLWVFTLLLTVKPSSTLFPEQTPDGTPR